MGYSQSDENVSRKVTIHMRVKIRAELKVLAHPGLEYSLVQFQLKIFCLTHKSLGNCGYGCLNNDLTIRVDTGYLCFAEHEDVAL